MTDEERGATPDRAVATSLGRSPVTAGARVSIEASPGAIWAVLIDVDEWQNWYGGVKDTRSSGPLEVGSRFTFSAGPASMSALVEELVHQERLRFTGNSTGSTFTYMFTLVGGDESTAVEAAQTMGGIATRAMKPVMQGVADKAVVRWLDALRARVED